MNSNRAASALPVSENYLSSANPSPEEYVSGRQAWALLLMIVGMVSDAATAADMPNGLGIGLLLVPIATFMTGVAMLIANERIAASFCSAVSPNTALLSKGYLR